MRKPADSVVAGLRGLRPADVQTAVAALGWVIGARIVLARGGFAAAMSRYSLQAEQDVETPARPLTPAARRAARIAQTVVRAPVLGATCLPRSIAVARVVSRHAVRADIVLGVTQLEGFAAHAWVEAGGERLDSSDYPEGAYQPAGRFAFGQ